jgi:EAL domain-containing protein (putative c-di-GMP-specific phosphodiesterase class I)/GGDEF domain-containing protein
MSLIKQLWLVIVVILTLAFAGTFALSTVMSKHYFERQLQAKNDDNATTLALSITQLNKDPVMIDLLIAAQFDTGHYQYIGLIDPNGKPISERINKSGQSKAPDWFIKSIPLKLSPGIADIQDGWTQYGTLKMMSDSNIAYDKLWDYSIFTALWTLLLAIISCFAGSVTLKKILMPLDDVVNQAQAIGENRFITSKLPKTKEFRAVINAMNALSNRVKKTVSEETARLEQLRVENNFDHVTLLMNHNHFVNNINANIARTEYFHEGALIVSRLCNLANIDQQLGYKETNSMLKRIGEALQNIANQHTGTYAGRLNGTEFAVFFNTYVDTYQLGNQIKKSLEMISGSGESSIQANFITAASHVSNTDSAEKIISMMSKLIDSISPEQQNTLHLINAGDLEQFENSHENEWQSLLISALDNKRIKLESYPVLSKNGHVIHYESPVRLQLKPNEKWFCAGEFITWAAQFNLMTRLDELVFETAVAAINRGADPIGLNVSSSAMCNDLYITKVVQTIGDLPHVAEKLYFEISEQDAFEHLAEFQRFCQKVRVLGCKIGIEHVGSRISRLGELHEVGLHYIKIDASVIRGIDSNEANKTLLRGLCMIAHSIGVLTIAEGVNTALEIEAIKIIGIDGMTGPGIRL